MQVAALILAALAVLLSLASLGTTVYLVVRVRGLRKAIRDVVGVKCE